jgi:hypothetical protein
VADPSRKFALGYPVFEAGEFEMGVGIDQTRENDGVFELHRRNILGSRNY